MLFSTMEIFIIILLIALGIFVSYRWLIFQKSKINRVKNDSYALQKRLKAAEDDNDVLNMKIKNREKAIQRMAYTDGLTKLPNKKCLEKRMEAMIAEDQNFYILLIDIDNFKNVNDIMGHDCGDKLLKETCIRIEENLLPECTLYKMGGDEFIVLVEHYREKKAVSEIADTIRKAFNKAFMAENKPIYETVSIGISAFPEDGNNVVDIIKNAEMAMYESKRTGKNKHSFFSQALSYKVKRKNDISKYLRNAIEKKEFEIMYQPQFDISEEVIYGCEALIRWKSSEIGPVMPSEFIPVAEENGFICEMEEWVLKEVCRQNSQWFKDGIRKVAAVNISALHFEQDNFAQSIKKILDETGLPGKYLEIEITETALMKSLQKATDTIGKLKDLGIRVSLDDFGTGYSSFSYLINLPIDGIKIDKSLVDDIGNSSSSKSIINGLVKLAHTIDLSVTAEGVEMGVQEEILKEIQCDVIQGYYYSEPVCPEEMGRMYRN